MKPLVLSQVSRDNNRKQGGERDGDADLVRMVSDPEAEPGDGLLQLLGRDLDSLGGLQLLVLGVATLHLEGGREGGREQGAVDNLIPSSPASWRE